MSRSEDRRKARGEGGSNMKGFYIILAVVAVIGIGAVGYSVGSQALAPAVSAPIDLEGLDDQETLIALATGVVKGDSTAPVKIVEFGDFQCPGCGAFALGVKPQIELMLINQGKAQFIFYDFPLTQIHGNAFLAARAARCSLEQDAYWAYHDLLFRNQTMWSNDSAPAGTFAGYAADVGMDRGDFEDCLHSERYADVVTANMELGYRLGVGSTPTVLVQANGQIREVSATDFRSIQQAIELVTQSDGNAPGN